MQETKDYYEPYAVPLLFMNGFIHLRDTECLYILISAPDNGGHRLRLLSRGFGAEAQRRVPQLPSAALHQPAALCAPDPCVLFLITAFSYAQLILTLTYISIFVNDNPFCCFRYFFYFF